MHPLNCKILFLLLLLLQLLDTLPVCRDFKYGECKRAACKYIHLLDGKNTKEINKRIVKVIVVGARDKTNFPFCFSLGRSCGDNRHARYSVPRCRVWQMPPEFMQILSPSYRVASSGRHRLDPGSMNQLPHKHTDTYTDIHASIQIDEDKHIQIFHETYADIIFVRFLFHHVKSSTLADIHIFILCDSLIVSFHLIIPRWYLQTVVSLLDPSYIFFSIWSLSQDHQMSPLTNCSFDSHDSVSHALRFRRGFLFVSLYIFFSLSLFFYFLLSYSVIC